MKQLLILLVLLCSYVLCGAQATTLTVDNQTPGEFSKKLNALEKLTVENLTVSGVLNLDDLKFIASLIWEKSLNGKLDLSNVRILYDVLHADSTMCLSVYPNYSDKKDYSLSHLVLPKSLRRIYGSETDWWGTRGTGTIDTLTIGSENMPVLQGNALFQAYTSPPETMGYYFHDNIRVNHINIREGVKEIGSYCFYRNQDNLRIKSFSFPSTLTKYGPGAFIDSDYLLDTIRIPSTQTVYHTITFPKKQKQVIVFPKSVQKINNKDCYHSLPMNTYHVCKNYITNQDTLVWIMESPTPPDIEYGDYAYGGSDTHFLYRTTVYIPKGSTAAYTVKNLSGGWTNPFQYAAKLIEIIPIDTLSFSKDRFEAYVGDRFSISPIITPSNASNQELTWSSSNPEISTVDSLGNICALHPGKTTISIISTEGNHKAQFELHVYNHVTSMSIPETLDIEINEKKIIKPTFTPLGETNEKVEWSSSDVDVATIDEYGKIKGISKGSCTITATAIDGNFQANCALRVIQPVTSISISTKDIELSVGSKKTLTATVLPINADIKEITWLSSDQSIATVDLNGGVSALSPGNVKIYSVSKYNPQLKDSCEVTVLQPVTGITLNESSIELEEDESYQLTATIQPSSASNKRIKWISSDISIAMVSGTGMVYALKPGKSTIMASTEDGGYVAMCKVQVSAKTIQATEIRLSHTSESIEIGESIQLSATVLPENTTNKTVKWTCTNTSVANVSNDGLVKALKEGNCQIIATTTDGSNHSAICNITVKKQFVYITDISIEPSDAKIEIGESYTLNATIIPSDATNKQILWSSTNPKVATVGKDGTVTAIAKGSAVIIASTQDGSNLSSTCYITVCDKTIFITKIGFDRYAYEGNVNDYFTINTSILPENATDKTINWSSSDNTIASVNNGTVTLLSPGAAIIKAEANDKSGIFAECNIKVNEEVGIDSIISDDNSVIRVYTISGLLVYEGLYSELNITPGIYVIICNGKASKLIIE